MRKYASAFFIFSLTLSSAAIADSLRSNYIISQQQKCKGLTYQKSKICINEVLDKADSLYPRRGTDEYSQKEYRGLNKETAYKKLLELKELHEKSKNNRSGSFTNNENVTSKDITYEGWWIQKNILGVKQSTGDPWFKPCKEQSDISSVTMRCDLK